MVGGNNVMGRILTNLSFFSGVGGLDLGAKMAGGIKTICYCENDRYAQGVLRSRIADGGLDNAPIWSDVNDFDGKPWQGTDIVSGGFPLLGTILRIHYERDMNTFYHGTTEYMCMVEALIMEKGGNKLP